MAYTRFNFRDEEERIEFLIALPILAFFGCLLYYFVFGDSTNQLDPGFGGVALAAETSDLDGDGIPDTHDHCATKSGTAKNNGCPENDETDPRMALDSDGDGLTDDADRCPTETGSITAYGCPAQARADTDDVDAEVPLDGDGDGIGDTQDLCPTEAGTAANDGCPEPEQPQVVDADGDGVADREDSCPSEAGIAANNGCPEVVAVPIADSDKDGVADSEDLCPQSAGVTENRGCPADSDADGLPDSQDQCPNRRGTIESGGCPADRDDDGVEDGVDQCIDEPGDPANKGCPLDTDGDGIADAVDECPDLAAPGNDNGCPVENRTLESLGADITFETASARLTQESQELLDVVASILNKYPAVKLIVEGHTDDQGQPDINLKLSEQRARACTTYLARQGVAEERMQSVGYGDTRPLVANSSEENRKRNRRVEFKLTN